MKVPSGAAALCVCAVAALGVAGCGTSSNAPKGAKKVAVTLVDSGCTPQQIHVAAGPVSFDVSNGGTQPSFRFLCTTIEDTIRPQRQLLIKTTGSALQTGIPEIPRDAELVPLGSGSPMSIFGLNNVEMNWETFLRLTTDRGTLLRGSRH